MSPSVLLSWLRALAILGWSAGVAAARGEIGLELQVPASGTHVLGDTIPLGWRFHNRGERALGFMWEGCCRQNGRLEVQRGGEVIQAVPPSQALAHMFAKADRLDPGQPRDYETRLGDWVVLPGTGTYELRGIYRGVLSNQVPQLPRGLGLWRDASTSAPVRIHVLGVADYLAERDTRSASRGLRLEVTGDARLVPLQPAHFRVRVVNTREQAATVRWPEAFSLWVVATNGHRAAPAAAIVGDAAPWVIPARGTAEREFTVMPDRFEGEPLGSYRVFVDLAADDAGGGDRVPSNVVPFDWTLRDAEVGELLLAAARGAGTGARNAPLKWLRVYLAELGPTLSRVSAVATAPEARELGGRLARAAQLKAIAPVPGRVTLGVRVEENGKSLWEDARVTEALAGHSEVDAGAISELLTLRRHLGWDVEVRLSPVDAVRMQDLRRWTESLAAQRPELAGPVFAQLGATNARVVVEWAANGEKASGHGLRLASDGTLRQAGDAESGQSASTGDVRAKVREARIAGGGILELTVAGGIPWQTVRTAVESVAEPGDRWRLHGDGLP